MPPRDDREVLSYIAVAMAALSTPALSQDAAMSAGLQRAIASTVDWEVRDAAHPALGNIRFAYIKRPIETRVGDLTIFSRAYVSCQKDRRAFAIELANALAPAEPGGLKPAADPRLLCDRPENGKVVREEILATWEINARIGDALSRGLRAFPLRECAALGVVQEVVLPDGAPQRTARIELEILPYDRQVDSIFAACGERSAYGTPPPAALATQAAAVATLPAESRAENGWREVRTVAGGATNVRKGPSTQASVVAKLHPGSAVRVQRTDSDWWRARPANGSGFDGFIREDRLVIR